VLALVASVAVHLAFSLWPAEPPASDETPPLQATITELPPPPAPAAKAPPPDAKPKARRSAARAPAPVAVPDPTADAPAPEPPSESMAAAPAAEPPVPPATAIDEPPAPPPDAPPKVLPPRVDLVYKAFFGTRGFLIGEATYRFEHADNAYRIYTVGQARGLAAIFLRGQGKVESRGVITTTGLQPLEFSVERGSRDKRETALFDWEAGIVTLQDNQTAALDLPTFDPAALMWQYYFTPPPGDEVAFSVATTRRLLRYTIHREATETIAWGQGEIATERWHRRSEDGATDAWVWLAPSLHFLPVKMRVVNTARGTVEALLDSIRVDAPETLQ
jgi:hypothetical protein